LKEALVILEPNPAASRGRRVLHGIGLALLSGLAFGAAGAGPGAFPTPVVALMPTVASSGAPAREACGDGMSGSFSGTFSEGPEGTELNGTHSGDFVLQQRLGDGMSLCARVEGPVRFDERDGSILELPRGSSVEVETRRGRTSQRMLVTEESGQPKHQWWLNGSAQAVDANARAWLGDALAAINGYRQIGSIQGQVGSLQGQIGSIQGEVGSLQGKVGSIQGERGSLQGQIGSHQGAIGGLQGSRWQADAAQKARIDREIDTHEAAIRKLEAEMDARDFPARLTAAEKELDSFDGGEAKTRIADLARQIQDVRADERIAALEKQIRDLHADERIQEIEGRTKPVVERLKRQAAQPGS
jgi:predicted  nucleic acid-binding Zn-ribbon protein